MVGLGGRGFDARMKYPRFKFEYWTEAPFKAYPYPYDRLWCKYIVLEYDFKVTGEVEW